jgi:hypothetical protein
LKIFSFELQNGANKQESWKFLLDCGLFLETKLLELVCESFELQNGGLKSTGDQKRNINGFMGLKVV